MTKGRNQQWSPAMGRAMKPEAGQRASDLGTQCEVIDRGREVSCNRHTKLLSTEFRYATDVRRR
jgi:hypothetical protein